MFDMIITSLLMVTIFYAWLLNRKLSVIRNQKDDLARSLQSFSSSTDSAIMAIEELQTKGEQICKALDEKIKKAGFASDELDIMLTKTTRKLSELNSQKPQVLAQPNMKPKLTEAQILKILRDREYNEAIGAR